MSAANSNNNKEKVAYLEKQRNKMLSEMEKKKQDIMRDTQVKIGSDKFITQNDHQENELKRQTIGLVQLEDFQRIKDSIEAQSAKSQVKTVKKKIKKAVKSQLSFDIDEIHNEDEENNNSDVNENGRNKNSGDVGQKRKPNAQKSESNEENDEEGPELKLKKRKSKKNPDVDTSFLPDKERDEAERMERERLARIWTEEQERIKAEKIMVTFSYWDGTGHRYQVECVKGDSIAKFLEKCRVVVDKLKGVHVDNMMFIKEDLIIPHHYTFYDFIANKTRGKSGPLFAFDVKDDIRLVMDASVETEESHAGKVLLRSWYERNKHIFPANRWEIFDAEKDYGKYTIKGNQ